MIKFNKVIFLLMSLGFFLNFYGMEEEADLDNQVQDIMNLICNNIENDNSKLIKFRRASFDDNQNQNKKKKLFKEKEALRRISQSVEPYEAALDNTTNYENGEKEVPVSQKLNKEEVSEIVSAIVEKLVESNLIEESANNNNDATTASEQIKIRNEQIATEIIEGLKKSLHDVQSQTQEEDEEESAEEDEEEIQLDQNQDQSNRNQNRTNTDDGMVSCIDASMAFTKAITIDPTVWTYNKIENLVKWAIRKVRRR